MTTKLTCDSQWLFYKQGILRIEDIVHVHLPSVGNDIHIKRRNVEHPTLIVEACANRELTFKSIKRCLSKSSTQQTKKTQGKNIE